MRCFAPVCLALACLALAGCFDSRGCPDVWEPVCGVDGETYSNGCYAERAGVGIDHTGACSDTPGVCTRDGDCEPGFVCDRATGACLACECTEEYAPVCGTDGVTYGNACGASCAHVGVAYPGECRAACSTPAECGPGETCVIYDTYCDAAAGAPAICEPGACDVPCMDIGRCEPVEPVCASDLDCGASEYCDTTECLPGPDCVPGGTCDRACYGRCVVRPVCPDVLCAVDCPFGFGTDEMGCTTCECLPPPPGSCLTDDHCTLEEMCDLTACGGGGVPYCPPEEPGCEVPPDPDYPVCLGTCVPR